MRRNARIKSTKTTAMAICTRRLSRSSSGRCTMSTQKLVVRAVSAESALENEAATMPMVKNTVTRSPNEPVAANMGRSSSPACGRGVPFFAASRHKSTPSDIKSRLAGTKATPYVHMSFCASRSDLQVRFFCIISWSRPVMTMTMKMPLRNCFQKYCLDIGSSKTKIWLRLSAAIAATASPIPISNWPITLIIIRMRAVNMQVVWKVSVHTSVLIPPLRV